MSAEPIPGDLEVPVSEARAQLADLIEKAEGGQVIYLSRHGRRVAAITPPDLPAEAASTQARVFARRFADRHPDLLRRLAE